MVVVAVHRLEQARAPASFHHRLQVLWRCRNLQRVMTYRDSWLDLVNVLQSSRSLAAAARTLNLCSYSKCSGLFEPVNLRVTSDNRVALNPARRLFRSYDKWNAPFSESFSQHWKPIESQHHGRGAGGSIQIEI